MPISEDACRVKRVRSTRADKRPTSGCCPSRFPSQDAGVGVSTIRLAGAKILPIPAGGRALQSGHQAKSTVITTCAKIEKKKEKSFENLVKMQLHQLLLLSIASQTTVAQRLVEAGSLVTFI